MTELPGFRHLAGYFGPPEQTALLGELRAVIEAAPLFVPRMPRSGKRQNQSADLRLQNDRQYVFERHVTIVRRL